MLKKLSISLGFMIFMFGFLKFFSPFKTWYSIQIQTSGLPEVSYAFGIISEMIVGIMLMSGPFVQNEKLKLSLLRFGSLGLIGIMCVAIYVHLLPDVPGEVLPMKIKPPIIPVLFLLATIYNLYLSVVPKGSLQRVKS